MEKLAREGGQMTVQHLRDLENYAALCDVARGSTGGQGNPH